MSTHPISFLWPDSSCTALTAQHNARQRGASTTNMPHRHENVTALSDLCLYVLAFFVPPAVVFIKRGCVVDVLSASRRAASSRESLSLVVAC